MQTNKSNGQLTAQINVDDHKKSGFDLSNNVLGTGKIGRIIPTRALHVMPNDTIKADSKVAVQFEPLAVPILANMDVKQEHFYVPYNIVWKNWDKFISGGEKMDYKGVVPNITMTKCFVALSAVFNNSAGSIMRLPVSKDENGEYILNTGRSIDTWYDSVNASLDYVGDKYLIKDLLKPCYESLLNMYNDLLIEGTAAGASDKRLFYKVTSVSDLDDVRFTNFIETNKYIKQLIPAYKSMLEAGTSKVFIPNDLCMKYLLHIYEYFKPFIGIGSNLDYLNMARITFTDFVFLYSKAAYSTDSISTSNLSEIIINSNDLGKLPMSVLNLRANYNIWFNNYRDILLEADAMEPVDIDEITNDELFVLLVPRQRCWEKDAFTTALDNPGTGNVGVPIHNSNFQAVQPNDPLINSSDFASLYPMLVKHQINPTNPVEALKYWPNGNDIYEVSFGGETYSLPTAFLTGINHLTDDSNSYTGAFSLYALDAAQRAQKWLQKALFFGNRISDFYYMHFGVRFLDARLRLPELLTSSSELVKLDVVMNNTNITTEANGEIFQSIAGDRAAYASAYDNGNSFERYCEEHGVIMSYLTIMPQVTYAYGMNRDYSRLDQFDFAFSEFATLGMDAVYDSEITSISVDLPNDAQDVKVFGYQGKYYDYKAKHSEEHGELLDSQDMYTFSRKFNMYDPNGRPKLNYEFVHCFPDLDMFVVDSSLSDYFRYDIRHSTAAERNLPSQSIYI